MLYKFKSKAGGDVLMLAPQAQPLLEIMGKSTTGPGILLPGEMPAALQALERAIAQDAGAPADGGDGQEAAEPVLGLKQRAWPLMQLIRAAQAADLEVVWGV